MIRRQDNTPGGLAAELDAHRQRWEAGRASVIARGQERVAQIAALTLELERETAEHQKVLNAAQP